jgi:prepilin-type processing-associated H-X9-DG protein
VRIVDITDGSSHTIFVGEKKCDDGDLGWMSGTRATLRNAGTQLNLTGGGPPMAGSVKLMDQAGQAATPAKPIDYPDAPIVAAGPIQSISYVGGFGSWHSGGVANFGFGDGRVQVLADDISPKVLRQLANRADGGVIDAEEIRR